MTSKSFVARHGLNVGDWFIANNSSNTITVSSQLIINSTGYFIGANAVFHPGNMGANSGLDADKLDGLDSTAFIKYAGATANLIWTSDNTSDIGASGATRPRNIFVGNTVTVANLITSSNVTSTHTLTGANASFSGTLTLTGTVALNANQQNQSLTDAATIAWDTSAGKVATVTLTANGHAFGAPSNLKVGTYILHVIQGGTGSYQATWNSVFKWTAAVAPVLSTAVGARDVFTFVSDGTNLYGAYLPDCR